MPEHAADFTHIRQGLVRTLYARIDASGVPYSLGPDPDVLLLLMQKRVEEDALRALMHTRLGALRGLCGRMYTLTGLARKSVLLPAVRARMPYAAALLYRASGRTAVLIDQRGIEVYEV